MKGNKELVDARNLAMLETSKPDWFVFDYGSSIEIHANKAGFEYLGKKMLDMADAAPGDDHWLPADSRVVEMGPAVLILQMAGKKPSKPTP